MKLKRYYILGMTLRDTMYCYDYMRSLLSAHIRFADRHWRIIDIAEYRLIFTSEELYHRRHELGNHSTETLSCYYVEKLLDTYRTLSKI